MGVLGFIFAPYTPVLALLLYYFTPYLRSYKVFRRIPGPFLARFSGVWLFWHARQGKRSVTIDHAHKKYGKIVRIQPNYVSIADETAIPAIYGHANGLFKSDFYRAFVSNEEFDIFNVRDRAQHVQRRKLTAHVYSAKALSQLEVYVRQNIELLVQQWDRMADKPENNCAIFDCLLWFSMLAFDIIGDLAFGQSFGMLEKGDDTMEFRKTPEAPSLYASIFQAIDERSLASATLGCLPRLKPYAKYLPDPIYRRGSDGTGKVTSIAISRVTPRVQGKFNPGRPDMLALLLRGRYNSGPELNETDLTSEAVGFLFAGAETVANTACSIFFFILRTAHVLPKLRAELDATLAKDTVVPHFDQVKSLPYLHHIINEALRIHPTISIGLAREVPPGPGIHILGRHFPAGTELSVPTYTIHHSAEIWGADAEEFIPERWECLTDRQKVAFIPFSHGPRSCLGRNQAIMELALIIATTVRRWDFELYTKNLEFTEGFTNKPIECLIGVKKRV